MKRSFHDCQFCIHQLTSSLESHFHFLISTNSKQCHLHVNTICSATLERPVVIIKRWSFPELERWWSHEKNSKNLFSNFLKIHAVDKSVKRPSRVSFSLAKLSWKFIHKMSPQTCSQHESLWLHSSTVPQPKSPYSLWNLIIVITHSLCPEAMRERKAWQKIRTGSRE
jgi:hypothetical protein